jgi:predicted phosphodiesterase
MRVLIISDIHANIYAFNACRVVFPAREAVWNLGDLVGYGANPNEVIAGSRELGRTFVRGNHDKACSGVSDLEGFNPVAALAAVWTQKNLTGANLDWLKALAKGPVKPSSGLDVSCVHGSPIDEDEYLLNLQDAAESLAHALAPLTFFGHTHIQGGFFARNGNMHAIRPAFADPRKQQKIEFRLEPGTVYLINPGSIGQPRDGDPRAGFAMYDSDAAVVTFYRVPYDIAAAQKDIRDAGLPTRLADRLAEGR